MAERVFPGFILRSSATKDGSRYAALLSSHPEGAGFPSYFAVYENRSFRDEASASAAADKALGLVLGVEEDGEPYFAEGETGFDDDKEAAHRDHGEETRSDDADLDDSDVDDDEDHAGHADDK